MEFDTPKPVQVFIEGIDLKSFFKDNVVKLFEEKWPNFQFQHFCIYVSKNGNQDDEEFSGEKIFIGYNSPNDEKINKVLIDTENSETLNKLIETLKEI